MIFTPVEIEEVLNVYQDESQDPNYISESTGIELGKVISILTHLQSQGDIEDFGIVVSENKVLMFNEYQNIDK